MNAWGIEDLRHDANPFASNAGGPRCLTTVLRRGAPQAVCDAQLGSISICESAITDNLSARESLCEAEQE